MPDKKDEPKLIDVGEEIMRFYVTRILEGSLPPIYKEVLKHTPNADPEYVMQRIRSEVMGFSDEAATKFNSIAILLLNCIATNRISELRDFEAKFIDLLERTLLRNRNNKAPIVVNIPDNILKSLEDMLKNQEPSDD